MSRSYANVPTFLPTGRREQLCKVSANVLSYMLLDPVAQLVEQRTFNANHPCERYAAVVARTHDRPRGSDSKDLVVPLRSTLNPLGFPTKLPTGLWLAHRSERRGRAPPSWSNGFA